MTKYPLNPWRVLFTLIMAIGVGMMVHNHDYDWAATLTLFLLVAELRGISDRLEGAK